MIYCTGDSFTAGTELVDFEYFTTSYPGTFNEEYSNNFIYKDWWQTKVIPHFYSLSLQSREIKLSKEKSKSWPAKLEKILNVPISNFGHMGSSIEFLVRNMITEILLSKDTIKLVIIQLPPIERIELGYKNQLYNVSLSNNKHQIPSIQHMLKYLVFNETAYTLQRRYLFNMIQLADFCKINNIKLIAVGVDSQQMLFDNKLNSLKNYISDIFCQHLMYNEVKKLQYNVFCPGGHFTEKVHDSFAQTLASYINEQQLL